MKLLVFVVLITFWATIIAKRIKNHRHDIDNLNETETVHNYTLFDLNGELRKKFFLLSANLKAGSNSLCSPLSALLPLAKLALGAEEKSLEELLDTIGVSAKSKIQDSYQPLLTRLRYLPGVKLDIASRVFMSDRFHLNRGFRHAAVEIFHSSVDKIDFTFPTYAAEIINSWVLAQTNGIIKDMVIPQDITPTTSLLLVNAVYFNGRWKEAFEKVSNVTFYYSTSSQKLIEMMVVESEFNYTKSDDLGAQIISIPYNGEGASLVVVCPDARDGLASLLALLQIASEKLADALVEMKPTRVKFTMPKFKLHHEFDLGLIYSKMGLKTIFDSKLSGLTKIVRNEIVFLSSAKQKCFIDVNEYGTEAAASSVLAMAKLSNTKPIEFLVDHPFLYFILVNDQQLFSGIFDNPDII